MGPVNPNQPRQHLLRNLVNQQLGLPPNQSILGGLMGKYLSGGQRQQQDNAPDFDRQMATTDESGSAGGQFGSMPSMDTYGGEDADSFARGGMVTKPTLAVLGDQGPEKVEPLTDQPQNKVNTHALGGGTRTRFQHLTGPTSMGRYAPLRSDLPLKPNLQIR